LLGHLFGGLAQRVKPGLSSGLRFALQLLAFADQGFKDLGALGLRLGKSAQTGQPDVLGRVFDLFGALGQGVFGRGAA
jgi:hypothetical protein